MDKTNINNKLIIVLRYNFKIRKNKFSKLQKTQKQKKKIQHIGKKNMNQQFRVKIKTEQDQMIQEDQILFPGY